MEAAAMVVGERGVGAWGRAKGVAARGLVGTGVAAKAEARAMDGMVVRKEGESAEQVEEGEEGTHRDSSQYSCS